MSRRESTSSAPPTPIVVVRRRFDAPPELIFDAWLDPDAVGRWLFATPDGEMQRVELDARVGGSFQILEKRGEAFADHFGTYLEIERPKRLVFFFSTDREENPTRVTVEIEPRPGGCELTLTHEMDAKWVEFADRAATGWTMILEGLASTLLGDRSLVYTREFDAPRELVWRVWTEPEHVVQWWGPSGFRTTSHSMDVRPGGAWSHTMHGPGGTNYLNHIVYLEVAKPERLVYEHHGEKIEAPVHFQTRAEFEDLGGRTRLTMTMVFPTAEVLDQVVRVYGADKGAEEMLARLSEHLAKT